ncbi:hypothetical protein [Paenibacillus sp. 1A_MP2]
MTYRVNLEQGNLVFENGELKVNPNNAPGFVAELSPDSGYYHQLKYFIQSVQAGAPVSVCTPESATGTLELIEAEMRSADERGALVSL